MDNNLEGYDSEYYINKKSNSISFKIKQNALFFINFITNSYVNDKCSVSRIKKTYFGISIILFTISLFLFSLNNILTITLFFLFLISIIIPILNKFILIFTNIFHKILKIDKQSTYYSDINNEFKAIIKKNNEKISKQINKSKKLETIINKLLNEKEILEIEKNNFESILLNHQKKHEKILTLKGIMNSNNTNEAFSLLPDEYNKYKDLFRIMLCIKSKNFELTSRYLRFLKNFDNLENIMIEHIVENDEKILVNEIAYRVDYNSFYDACSSLAYNEKAEYTKKYWEVRKCLDEKTKELHHAFHTAWSSCPEIPRTKYDWRDLRTTLQNVLNMIKT